MIPMIRFGGDVMPASSNVTGHRNTTMVSAALRTFFCTGTTGYTAHVGVNSALKKSLFSFRCR